MNIHILFIAKGFKKTKKKNTFMYISSCNCKSRV